jgi:hypothetical protein
VIVVGVDPGKEGAIVRLADDARYVCAMPVVAGEKRDEYDVPEVLRLLDGAGHVFIERLQAMPMKFRRKGSDKAVEGGGTIANYNRGFCMALFVTACVALKLPFTLVRPQEWQRELLAGIPGEDTKQRSILAAQRLFPGVDLRRTVRCKGPSDGIADALLIAEWGRRRLAGKEV